MFNSLQCFNGVVLGDGNGIKYWKSCSNNNHLVLGDLPHLLKSRPITQMLTAECYLIADNWSEKACRRRTQGVGRMRHMKKVFRRFRYVVCASCYAASYSLKLSTVPWCWFLLINLDILPVKNLLQQSKILFLGTGLTSIIYREVSSWTHSAPDWK